MCQVHEGAQWGELRDRGYDVVQIDAGTDVGERLRQADAQVVVNGLHGTYGEDGCVQGLLEVLGLPYTGSPPLGSALAFDKVPFKQVLDAAGIPSPAYEIIEHDTRPGSVDLGALGLPLVVKPAAEGSSVGVTIARTLEAVDPAIALARLYGDGRVVCEAFVAGMETTVGVLDGIALGTVEIVPATEFYDYEAKYLRDDTQYHAPARLPADVLEEMARLAEQTHRVTCCAGATRVDMMIGDNGRPLVIEVNTLPGMTDHSLLPMAAKQAGMSFGDLVEAMLDRARTWHTPRPSIEEGT